MRREEGSASPGVLAVLILLAAALAGLTAILPTARSYERRSRETQAGRERLEKAANEVLEALTADPTPGSDSLFDPVWNRVNREADGVTVELRDISSRLNPNYVRKKLLEETALKGLLAPGATPESLQQYREDKGLSASLAHYRDFFPASMEKYLTCYGWANVNTTDEFVLRSLHRYRKGSREEAEAFHSRIQTLLADRRIVAEAELPGFLGADAGILEPTLSAVPSWNVHFLDPFLLGEILAYPPYGLAEPSKKSSLLLGERGFGELSESRVAVILGVPENHVLLHYLGTRTWFWEIRARNDRGWFVLVAARDPRADRAGGAGRPRFIVLERRWSA
jgi:hypothetical protein